MKALEKTEVEEVKGKVKRGVGFLRRKWKLALILLVAAVVLVMVGVIRQKSAKIEELNAQISILNETIREKEETPVVIDTPAPEITLDQVSAEIQEIGELATSEYFYTNAARYSDAKQIKGIEIPFTKKNFILKWDGTIKAGIDLEKIEVRLDNTEHVITICLPEAEILSHDPDEDSVEILAESDTIFNPITVEEKTKFDAVMSKEMEQRAIDNGLLERARKNAENVITRLLFANPDIESTYTIKFENLA